MDEGALILCHRVVRYDLTAVHELIARRGQVCDPEQDGHEQVVVELNSGRSYFVPREAVERLFRFCPAGAAALVARVSTLREPLDPSGLPSEAGVTG